MMMINQSISSSSFLCWFCEKNLTNDRYVIQGHFAVCLRCYDQRYARICSKCQLLIGIEMQGINFQEVFWHEKCFQCSICQNSLIEKKFAFRNDQLFCQICLIDRFGQRCDRCNRPFHPAVTIVNYQGRVYHSTCFLCQQCSQPINFDDVRRHDQDLVCSKCAEQLLIIRCVQCREKISNDGIIYENHPFHRRCLRCHHCHQSFQDEGYVRFDHRLYCLQCISSLLNKRTHVTSSRKP